MQLLKSSCHVTKRLMFSHKMSNYHILAVTQDDGESQNFKSKYNLVSGIESLRMFGLLVPKEPSKASIKIVMSG